jgi:shikimate kinase
MLQEFGDPQFYALKQQVLAAVAAGEDPSVIAIGGDRFLRTSIRVALRQLKAADGISPSLMTWLSAHERPDQIEMEEQSLGCD